MAAIFSSTFAAAIASALAEAEDADALAELALAELALAELALAEADALAELALALAADDELFEEQPTHTTDRQAATAIAAIDFPNFIAFLPFGLLLSYSDTGLVTLTLWSYQVPFSPRIATSNSSPIAGTGTSNPYTSSSMPSL